jgi:hypothetical protein
MPLADTNPAAQAVQFDILRVVSEKSAPCWAFEMSLFARELAKEGIWRAGRAKTAAVGVLPSTIFQPGSKPGME